MKIKILFIAIITSLTLLSFSTIGIYKSDKIIEKNTLDMNLEGEKTILAEYYSNLIKDEIDRRFNESKDGTINEKEMFSSVLSSFSKYSVNRNVSNVKIENNTLDLKLAKKKAILANYYSDLTKGAIDRWFSENSSLNIEGIISFIPETEYGCAYTESNCTGGQVCGVSRLYASTFGYASFSGENGGGCE